MTPREALGRASEHLERYEASDAYPLILDALAAEPDNALGWNQLTTCYMQKGLTRDAIAAARIAVSYRPDYADAQRNLGLLLLKTGEYDAAWEPYAHRRHSLDFKEYERPYEQPYWDGWPCEKLLVISEQGIGDQILYTSMIPDLIHKGQAVVLECDPRLVTLFARSFPEITVVGASNPCDERAEACDRQTLSGDLGQFLRRSAADFPTSAGYLKAAPYQRGLMRKKCLYVGFSGRSSNKELGLMKSCPLEYWEPVFDLNIATIPLDSPQTHSNLELLAATIADCDAVVTVSNTAAHMAGALGKPTLVMLGPPAAQYFYWGEGERTPWYPSVRITRQDRPGDWSVPIAAAVKFVGDLCVSNSENPSS